jgi:hypothetical protein
LGTVNGSASEEFRVVEQVLELALDPDPDILLDPDIEIDDDGLLGCLELHPGGGLAGGNRQGEEQRQNEQPGQLSGAPVPVPGGPPRVAP